MSPTTNIWQSVLDRLQTTLNEFDIKNWINNINFVAYENGKLTVEVPSSFFQNWIIEHYLEAIKTACNEALPNFAEIEIVINARTEQLNQEAELTQESPASPTASKVPQTQPQPPAKPRN